MSILGRHLTTIKTTKRASCLSLLALYAGVFYYQFRYIYSICAIAPLHTLYMLWEKFQWILPLYMKPISFQSKASVVCSVTAVVFIDFCLKKLNVFSQHIGKKTKWISESHRTNPQELKCWSTFYVDYFLRYYLMMQNQPIVKRFNGMHEWAHISYQPYQLLIIVASTNAGR